MSSPWSGNDRRADRQPGSPQASAPARGSADRDGFRWKSYGRHRNRRRRKSSQSPRTAGLDYFMEQMRKRVEERHRQEAEAVAEKPVPKMPTVEDQTARPEPPTEGGQDYTGTDPTATGSPDGQTGADGAFRR